MFISKMSAGGLHLTRPSLLATKEESRTGRTAGGGLPCIGSAALGSMVVLIVALFSSTAALAECGGPSYFGRDELERCHEYQVDKALSPAFDRTSIDRAWTWEAMLHACTRTLMFGSPEQNPEGGAVRFTEEARSFLVSCALTKGFRPRTTPEPPPVVPLTATTARRMDVVAKVFSAWLVDTSTSGVTVEQRDRACTDWIGTGPEWKFLVANEPDWKSKLESGAGATAEVTAGLLGCAQAQGFDVREDMKGEPLRRLNEAAEAERKARQR